MQKLLSTAELAELLNIPVTTIYAWRHKGAGPQGVRVGKHIRFRPGDVEAWLQTKEQQGGVDAA